MDILDKHTFIEPRTNLANQVLIYSQFFRDQVTTFPSIYQELRHVTFQFDRSNQILKDNALIRYKRYQGTQVILETLSKCQNLDLTITGRLDEIEDLVAHDFVNIFKAFTILPFPALPDEFSYCARCRTFYPYPHSAEILLGHEQREPLNHWAGWCRRLSEYFDRVNGETPVNASSSTLRFALHFDEPCALCLITQLSRHKKWLPVTFSEIQHSES